ncbi:MAG: hypothetical protein ABJ275_09275 [Maricaulaceae bacterium]
MAALFSVVMIITFPMIYTEYGQILDISKQNMQDILSGRQVGSSSEILAIYASVWKPYTVMTVLSLLIPVVAETALHRKNLLGAEKQTLPLRFAWPEIRTFIAMLGVWLLAFIGYFLGALALGIVAAIFAIISKGLVAIVFILGIVFVLGLWLWLSIRLAPASALSLQQNKLHVLAAKDISKGRFWPMLGSYAFVFFFGYIILITVVSLLMMLVFGDAQILSSINGFGDDVPSEQLKAIAEQLQPPFKKIIGVVALVAYFTFVSIWFLMFSGIGTYAVKLWSEE